MIKEERTKILLEMKDTSYAKATKDLIIEKIIELGNVENAKNWEDTLARAHAVNVLKKVFNHLKILKTEIKSSNRSQYE